MVFQIKNRKFSRIQRNIYFSYFNSDNADFGLFLIKKQDFLRQFSLKIF